jgi:hypothetical protein
MIRRTLGFEREVVVKTNAKLTPLVWRSIRSTSWWDQDHPVIDARGLGDLEIAPGLLNMEIYGSGLLRGADGDDYLHNGDGEALNAEWRMAA